MIIKIKNFGPIKEFEIDLSKDFSIIYGKNNIGKSYAVSVVYLILKNFYKYIMTRELLISRIMEKIETYTLSELEKKIEEMTNIGINFDSEDNTGLEKYDKTESEKYIYQKKIDELGESLIATFGDDISNQFSNQKTEIHIKTDFVEIVLCKTDDGFLISQFDIIEKNRVLDSEIGNIYYFPASRLGFYQSLSSLSPIFAELSKSRGSIKKSFEIPSIPEPVSDYFLALSSIKKKDISKDNPILQLAEEIEQTVLGGEVFFDDDTKKMIYKPYKTDLYLDMFQVSSMAAEISPLVLFLKYIIAPSHNKAESKSLLFIEEPEAHLHPETQIKLMEIFAKLVKHNIKIIITSHSDFMFNKMNNLILEKKTRYIEILCNYT